MGFIHQTSFYTAKSALSIYFFLVLITVQSTTTAAPNNLLPEMEPVGVDPDQILMNLQIPEQSQQMPHGLGEHLGEKRSWQNLQGSWGKRGDYNDYYTNQLLSVYGDDIPDYGDAVIQLRNGHDDGYLNEQKRGWKAMNGAWGKRVSNRGLDLNKYRGTSKSNWGKRQPGWDKLKGLWGKRSVNWNKLQPAWGKRDENNIENTY